MRGDDEFEEEETLDLEALKAAHASRSDQVDDRPLRYESAPPRDEEEDDSSRYYRLRRMVRRRRRIRSMLLFVGVSLLALVAIMILKR